VSFHSRKGLSGTTDRRNRRALTYTAVSIVLLLAGPLLLGGVGGWLGARFSDLLYSRDASPTEDALRAELLQLMLENSQLREEALKADSYRTLLGMTRTSDREALGARVLYRTEGLVSGSMVIDRGSEDGVVPNSACISFQGLVGVVSTVSPRTSEVLPITSPSINVSCVTWPSGAAGILESSAEGELRLVHVDLAGGAGTGDQVLTSRFSGIYPDGLLVGTVTGVSSGEPGLALELAVEPSVDFSRLGEILILLPVDSLGPPLE
jgi:rod shape-determining protein MreC